jgi:hypothetical protein
VPGSSAAPARLRLWISPTRGRRSSASHASRISPARGRGSSAGSPLLRLQPARGEELGGSRTHAPGSAAGGPLSRLPSARGGELDGSRTHAPRARARGAWERCRRPNRAAPARAGGAVCTAGGARRSPRAPVELARGPDGVRHGEGTTSMEGL